MGSVRILFEDEHLLVVEKPAGVVTHPARGHSHGTLSQQLSGIAAGGDPQRPGIVHRLDRDTSGLLLAAKDDRVHALLQRAIAERRVRREYLALVEGTPPSQTGTIDAPIGRDSRVRTKMAIGGASARQAQTHFAIERELGAFSLLRLWLGTGRTHQIRVHLQAIRHPVCGDPLYGTPGTLGLSRQFLHASRIAFEHPLSGAQVEVSSPLPSDLEAALELAQRLS